MRAPLEVEKAIEREKITAYVVSHLPIVKAYAVKMGLVDIINQLIPSKMDVEPGIIFLGMIMDTLSGRTPFYRLDEFFQD
jgi:transposase